MNEVSVEFIYSKYLKNFGGIRMITGNICVQLKKKVELNSELLASALLKKMFVQDVINYATYQKARKEIKDYGSAVSK